jgi:hypothetical protein
MCGRLRGCQEILMSKSNRCCGHVSGLFVSQVLATGPDEVRVSEAIQTRAIEIAVDSSVSSDQRSHSVWIFVIINFLSTSVVPSGFTDPKNSMFPTRLPPSSGLLLW